MKYLLLPVIMILYFCLAITGQLRVKDNEFDNYKDI